MGKWIYQNATRTVSLKVMTLSPTLRTRLNREKQRAVTDRAALHELLDRNLICHLGVLAGGVPRVLPTCYGRDGDTLYLHGSTGTHSLRQTDQVCVTVTEFTGIVYARSVFNFSINYASALIYGVPETLQGAEKLEGLRVLSEHLAPGAWDYSRRPSRKELAQTAVLRLDLAEASVKLRAGDPKDEPEDCDLPVWAGVLPVEQRFLAPYATADLAHGIPVPAHVSARSTPWT